MAVRASGQKVALREVVLRDKPDAFLAASASATVPCLELPEGVIDESLEIMRWALGRNDPQGWLQMPPAGRDWIARNDGPFKQALDGCKYASRYPQEARAGHLQAASEYLRDMDMRLDAHGGWLFGHATLADVALFPFVRQFAAIDAGWFAAQPWPALQVWLARHIASADFTGVMQKLPAWTPGQPDLIFP